MHETLTLHSLTQVGPTVNGGSVEEPVKFGHHWRPTGAEIDTGVRPVNTPGLIVWIEDVEETIVPLDDHGKREHKALGPNVIGGANRLLGTLLGALLGARDSKRRSVGRVAAFFPRPADDRCGVWCRERSLGPAAPRITGGGFSRSSSSSACGRLPTMRGFGR